MMSDVPLKADKTTAMCIILTEESQYSRNKSTITQNKIGKSKYFIDIPNNACIEIMRILVN